MNEKFINALSGKEQNVPPIWMMRQAGRYHNHYQNLRKDHTFVELCKSPELAAEVAMGPMEDFDFDVAILFSDILFPLEALGMPLDYAPGPKLGWQLNEETLSRLGTPDSAIGALDFQLKALEKTRSRLPNDKSLIGFIGGPWTLFSYAVQGSHQGGLIETKKMMKLYKPFCEKMLPLLAKNILLQLTSGAEVVMIFDTAAGEASPALYDRLILPSLKHLAELVDIQKVGYYSKWIDQGYLENLQSIGFAGFGFDYRWRIDQCLKQPRDHFVQGNFDQTLLHLSPEEFEQEFHNWLEPIKALTPSQRKGWVCGLGHGVLPKTPEENVRNFVRLVRQELS